MPYPASRPEVRLHVTINFKDAQKETSVYFAGLLGVQNILSADTGISRQTEVIRSVIT
jgi:hypothetical protein